MSLRKIAKILGISPTYLSLLLNGKRPWRGHLKERYLELVNTFVNTQEVNTLTTNGSKSQSISKISGGGVGNRTCDLLHAKQVNHPQQSYPVTSFYSN